MKENMIVYNLNIFLSGLVNIMNFYFDGKIEFIILRGFFYFLKLLVFRWLFYVLLLFIEYSILIFLWLFKIILMVFLLSICKYVKS